MFMCDEGFVWQNGDSSSVCGANGLWTPLTMVCEGKSCEHPSTAHTLGFVLAALPHCELEV